MIEREYSPDFKIPETGKSIRTCVVVVSDPDMPGVLTHGSIVSADERVATVTSFNLNLSISASQESFHRAINNLSSAQSTNFVVITHGEKMVAEEHTGSILCANGIVVMEIPGIGNSFSVITPHLQEVLT